MEQLPFDKRSGKIWFNNELVEWQDTKVHVISHGMHYASLVFEGVRVYNKKIFKFINGCVGITYLIAIL